MFAKPKQTSLLTKRIPSRIYNRVYGQARIFIWFLISKLLDIGHLPVANVNVDYTYYYHTCLF